VRIAYFDLIGGAAGDMILAALLDAGAPEAQLRAGLEGLGLDVTLEVSRTQRRGLGATRVEVRPGPSEGHHHRHLPDVLAILERGSLPARALARARAVFEALARAEGEVHGVPPEQVHFHEVGAVDAIIDVAGACLGLELLGVDRVESSPFPLAGGTVKAAHGTIPLPAPATLRLIEAVGAPVEGRAGRGELVTPTGAAILTALGERFGPFPAAQLERTGYGAGSREAPAESAPNLTRVALASAAGEAAPAEVVQLEANLDDETGERLAYLVERLLDAGALDAWLTPIQMKKGRPATLLGVLASTAEAGALEDLILRESSSLGVRRRALTRTVLPRQTETVSTPWGAVQVKVASRPDGRLTRAPEYEDCARLAREAGVPLRAVYEAALRTS
jgi:uncharacterized protein (TIGR00299 family) protein